jgi:hypothetical protein
LYYHNNYYRHNLLFEVQNVLFYSITYRSFIHRYGKNMNTPFGVNGTKFSSE